MISTVMKKEIDGLVDNYLKKKGYSWLNKDESVKASVGTPGNWTILKTAIPGTKIFASDRNNEFQNVINNSNPDGLASASNTISELIATRNPYAGNVPVTCTSLRGDIEELRFQIQAITGQDNWFLPPEGSLKNIGVTGGDSHNHLGLEDDPDNGGGALITTNAIEDGAIELKNLSNDLKSVCKITKKIIPTVTIPPASAYMPTGLDTSHPILPTSGYELVSLLYTPIYDEDNDRCVVIEYHLSVVIDNTAPLYNTAILVDNTSSTIMDSISIFGDIDNGSNSLIMNGRFISTIQNENQLSYSIRIGNSRINNDPSSAAQIRINAVQGSQSFVTIKEDYVSNV